MKVIISHPTSNQNNRAVLRGLHDTGMIYKFYTTIGVFPDGMLNKLSHYGPFKEIARRQFDLDLKQITVTSLYMELSRLLSSKMGFERLVKHETGLFSVDGVYQSLDKKVAGSLKKALNFGVNAVYAYEDGAFHTFREANKLGIECLYDLPIGYWKSARTLLSEEIENWPAWRETLNGFKDSQIKLCRKDEELALADRIFVASSFTAKTLQAYPEQLAPIKVIPYGFPEPAKNRVFPIGKKPIKLLFVGGLSQRKGIANMFAAVDALLPHVQLTVIGHKSTNNCEALDKALAKHHWIPSLPHNEILEQMRAHDVLLFPSLFEGFGLVITEAMSQGTPVITTDRTVGPDLIEHNRNGWLVEAGSTIALKNCIEQLIDYPEQIEAVGNAAIETAKQRPWHIYGRELAEAILEGK